MAVCSIWQFADFTNTGNCHIEHTAICCLCYAVVFLAGLHPIANVFKAAGEAFNWTISLGNLVLIAGAVFLLQHRQTQLKALSTQAAIAGLGNYHQQLFSISPLKVDITRLRQPLATEKCELLNIFHKMFMDMSS